MKRRATRMTFAPACPTVHIWTVVSLVEDRMYCSIHSSEYHAYREAVSRFESVELETASLDQTLEGLLETAHIGGDYKEVRSYIEKWACKLYRLQIAEHDVNSIDAYRVKAPNLVPRLSPLHS